MKASDLHKLTDRDLLAAVQVLSDGATGNEADFGLTAAQTAALAAELAAFEGELNALDAARAAEDAALGARDNRRSGLVAMVRDLMRRIRAHVGNDPAILGRVNLDTYDETKTDSPAPTSAPIAFVDYGKLKHTIHFRDSATPDTEAKPQGMLGCEIWRTVGDAAPASDDDLQFVTLDTASPYVAFYTMADAGKKVSYLLRWVSKSGEKGEWSETVEATVNG